MRNSTSSLFSHGALAALALTAWQPAPAQAQAGRTAFVEQIGDANRAIVRQTAPEAYARISQRGSSNDMELDQSGSGRAVFKGQQDGEAHVARVAQDGAGENLLALTQQGLMNIASVQQNASRGGINGAVVAQTGYDNAVQLVQDGQDNRAQLTQTGDGNRMTAQQNGHSNRLSWVQQGSNLPDLGISQTNGAVVHIMQTSPAGGGK